MHRRRRRGRGSVDDQRSRRARRRRARRREFHLGRSERRRERSRERRRLRRRFGFRVRRRLVFSPVVASHAAERERDGAEFRLRGSRAYISILLSGVPSVERRGVPRASRGVAHEAADSAHRRADADRLGTRSIGTHVATPRGGGRGARGGVRGGDGDGGGCGARAKFLGGGDERPLLRRPRRRCGRGDVRAAPAAHHRQGTLGSDASGRGRCASRAVSVSRRGHPRRHLARGGGVLVGLLGDGVWNGGARADWSVDHASDVLRADSLARARGGADDGVSSRVGLVDEALRGAFLADVFRCEPRRERGATHGTRAEIRLAASDEATPVEDVPALGGEELALHVLDVGIAPTLALEGAVAHGAHVAVAGHLETRGGGLDRALGRHGRGGGGAEAQARASGRGRASGGRDGRRRGR